MREKISEMYQRKKKVLFVQLDDTIPTHGPEAKFMKINFGNRFSLS
jgi:hypothetical protein